MNGFEAQFGAAARCLLNNGFGETPVGIILGTGMSEAADIIDVRERISFIDLPGLPASSVAFQSPSFISGMVGRTPVVCADGRFHFYEGHTMREVVSIVYLMHRLGVKRLFVNSAVGGINKSYVQGDLVMVSDHINLSTLNPLIGLRGADGRMLFPNMIDAYDADMSSLFKKVSAANAITVKEGVLAYLPGPAFETRSELRMLAALKADLVGWSMVPEVLFARALGIAVCGICCVSDVSDPDVVIEADIDDIVKVCKKAAPDYAALLNDSIRTMSPAGKP
ncbi:MAG: purine-nucleoside phosphorylase [Deltaproteobacteria bacterium]|nr:purine-nucleoside phosphorylase [Deltaproteobacteria bacterium]